MDLKKEQSIKNTLEAIKTQTDESGEIRIRKLKSLINQMNLHLLDNPDDQKKILVFQKSGYEAILHLLDNDKEIEAIEKESQKERTKNLITIVETEITSLS